MQNPAMLPDIEQLILSEVILASDADSTDPGFDRNWTVKGARRVCELADTLHGWIDRTVQKVGAALNGLNPVNKLPPEVLCIIFSLATAGDQAAQLRLSNVCRRWKAVALDHPVLWSNVEVHASRPASPDTLLKNLSRQLAYTKDVPTNLALYLSPRETAAYPAHMSPLEDHMFHLRSLALRLPPGALEQPFRAALTMPAPLLDSLAIILHGHPHRLAPFPLQLDTFSGHSPCLRRLSLTGLAIPPPAWQPLVGLTHLTMSLGAVAISDLVAVIQACGSLQFLVVFAAEGCIIPADWSTVPWAARQSPSVSRLSARLSLRDASPIILGKFLLYAGHPVAAYLDVHWVRTLDAWAWIAEPAPETTYVRLVRDPESPQRCMRLTARDDAGKTRSTSIRIQQPGHPLLQTLMYFYSLRELVVAERFWLCENFPSVPTLEAVTIVLERPSVADDTVAGFVGIFFLPMDPSATWILPALRTVRLSWGLQESLDEPSDGTASLARPLVVSAHDIAVFVTCHLLGSQPVDLILQNVVTYEGDDHNDTYVLNAVVASVSYETGVEVQDPFSREHM